MDNYKACAWERASHSGPLFPFLFSSVCPSSVCLFDLGSGLPVEPVQGSYTGVQSSPESKSKIR